MFRLVVELQAEIVEEHTRALITHELLFVFKSWRDPTVNIFVMLNEIHCGVKLLSAFRTNRLECFQGGIGMF